MPDTEAPSLVALMRMSPEEWDAWTRGSAIRRAGYAGLKRNVAVAMGSRLAATDDPPEEAVGVPREALKDGDPLARYHAESPRRRTLSAGRGTPIGPYDGSLRGRRADAV